MKKLTVMFLIIGFVSAFVAFNLSEVSKVGIDNYRGGGVGGGVDIAADGGALGFCILSGICFLCATMLQIEVFRRGSTSHRVGGKQHELQEVPEKKEEEWNCPKCDKSNPNTTFTCQHCGYRLRELT